ncbi:FxsA family protein [Rhodococcus sp. USK10]|uniref:Cytoplasmic membrane protein FsxA n=1 Tax=Rhodococcus wratislaviensis TaxID=44752 RepID=A0A402CCK7_RHOWR|nr:MULTISPECIES: FxsA family protein [Rhodococcus]QYB04341.1 FxsA family protein [Rhodococcus sp. USK10]GCE41362.1 Cytoplasmic membrane protein FsxA [Rhodococcus wratislaviensis]
MYAALFLLYVVVEIAALVLVGHAIGVLWTVLLLLGGTLIGLLLMRSQWRRVMDGLRRAAGGDGSPGAAVADGALVALGSALMFVPGLVTSVLGLLFLIPPTRWALRPVVVLLAGRRAATVAAGAEAFARSPRRGRGEVIEGEVVDEVFEGEVIDEDPRTPTRDPRVLP